MAGYAYSVSIYPLSPCMILYAYMRFIDFGSFWAVFVIRDPAKPQADWEQEELIRRCDTGRNGLSDAESIR